MSKLKAFLTRCLIITAAIVVTCMGHVYGSIAILLIASLIYKEVISIKKKEEAINRNVLFSKVEWYVYIAMFYALLPRLFLRRDLFKNNNGGISMT
jgi:CDP-diglyceride synthetase